MRVNSRALKEMETLYYRFTVIVHGKGILLRKRVIIAGMNTNLEEIKPSESGNSPTLIIPTSFRSGQLGLSVEASR